MYVQSGKTDSFRQSEYYTILYTNTFDIMTWHCENEAFFLLFYILIWCRRMKKRKIQFLFPHMYINIKGDGKIEEYIRYSVCIRLDRKWRFTKNLNSCKIETNRSLHEKKSSKLIFFQIKNKVIILKWSYVENFCLKMTWIWEVEKNHLNKIWGR